MTCPHCGSGSVVIHTEYFEDYKRRRRECRECHSRFNTVEIDEDVYRKMTPVVKTELREAIDSGLAKLKTDLYKVLKVGG